MKEILNERLRANAQRIKCFFCDVDGTLTDGSVYYSAQGEQLKKFSMRDGTGFFLLRQAGIHTGFITGEQSPIVLERAKKLQVDYYLSGTLHKLEAMTLFAKEKGLSLQQVAYIGDDINDLKLLRAVGLSFAVADAHECVKQAVDYICTSRGGHGAFREAAERLLNLKGIDIPLLVERLL